MGDESSLTLYLCLTCSAAIHGHCLTSSERAWVVDDGWMCDACCVEQATRAARTARDVASTAAAAARRAAQTADRAAKRKRKRKKVRRLGAQRAPGRPPPARQADAGKAARRAANAWLIGHEVSLPPDWGSTNGKIVEGVERALCTFG